MRVEFQGLVEGALLGGYFPNDPLGARLPAPVPSRVQQFRILDAVELIE